MSRPMLTALAVALTVAFLGGASRASDDGTPNRVAPKEKSLWEKAGEIAEQLWGRQPAKIAGRLKGRVLGGLIHRGMSLKQVEQILGGDPNFFTILETDLGHGNARRWHYYPDLGLLVLTTEQAGVLQVDQPVEFRPLLD